MSKKACTGKKKKKTEKRKKGESAVVEYSKP